MVRLPTAGDNPQVDTIDEESADSGLFTALVVALSSFVVLYPGLAFLVESYHKKKNKEAPKSSSRLENLSSMQTFNRKSKASSSSSTKTAALLPGGLTHWTKV